MAPFPETEIMTIKRLEVALRKADYKLLKDGAYKLHEKYHSGFRFEYLDLIKDILFDISNNSSVPEDIKDILIPTIKDILSSQGVDVSVSTSPYESMNKNQVSSLTSLSYSVNDNSEAQHIQQETTVQEPEKINAFSAFGSTSKGALQQNAPNYSVHTYSQSPFSAQPFKEFSTVSEVKNETIVQENEQNTDFSENIQESNIQENMQVQETFVDSQEDASNEVEQVQVLENKKETKTVAIFYNEQISTERVRNILKFRKLLSLMTTGKVSANDLLDLIYEINMQINSNVDFLKNVLNQLKIKENKVNLITNSQSVNFVELFNKENLNYSLFELKSEKDVNLFPIFGLSNLFLCSDCGYEHLFGSENTPMIAQCPKCKKAMFPNFYTTDGLNSEINIEYYTQSFNSLVNSKVWFLINPSADDKFCVNLLKNALKLSRDDKEIYILNKDINAREFYRNLFYEINNKIELNTQITALEDFLNSIN